MASGTIKIASWGIIHWFDGRRHTVHRFGSCRNSSWVVQFSALTGRNSSSKQLLLDFPVQTRRMQPGNNWTTGSWRTHRRTASSNSRSPLLVCLDDSRLFLDDCTEDDLQDVSFREATASNFSADTSNFPQSSRFSVLLLLLFFFFVFLKWPDGVVICGVVLCCNLLFLDWSHWWEKPRLLSLMVN